MTDAVEVDRRALAVALLGSKRPPLVVIWCGRREHRLGAVYDTGDVAGIVVAMRRAKLPPGVVPGDPRASLDAYAYPLEADPDGRLLGRCPHGVYSLDRARIRAWLAHPPHERGDFITAAWSRPAE